MQRGIDIGTKRAIIHIKQRGKVGIDMKREIISAMSASRLALSFDNAARFSFAQLFLGLFWFTPIPI